MKKKTKTPPNWEDRPDSFERFERLARGLMGVPRKALEERSEKPKTRQAKKKVK